MNKEEIEKEIHSRLDKLNNQRDSIFNNGYSQGFSDAVEWRINSVWHDATEVPETLKLLLVENKEGSISLCRILAKKSNTESWLRWAYIEDLLPNTWE